MTAVPERLFRCTIGRFDKSPATSVEHIVLSKVEIGPKGVLHSETVNFPPGPVRDILGSSVKKGDSFWLMMQMTGPNKARILIRKDRHFGEWKACGEVVKDDKPTPQTVVPGNPNVLPHAQNPFKNAPDVIAGPKPSKIIVPPGFN